MTATKNKDGDRQNDERSYLHLPGCSYNCRKLITMKPRMKICSRLVLVNEIGQPDKAPRA